jgi:hypothetical protein
MFRKQSWRYAQLNGGAVAVVLAVVMAPPHAQGQAAPKPNYHPRAVFSNPTAITNPYLPLAHLKQDVLSGTEDKKPSRVVRTRLPGTRKFMVNGKPVNAVIVADSAFEDGKLAEVALDYFAQSDAGDVYYLGEDVDNYENGKVANHEGAWLYGVHTQKLGLMFPATPKVGQRYRSEDVKGITQEDDEVMSVKESATVPAGKFQDCVKVKETAPDGVEYKVYCRGTGVIQEIPGEGRLDLQSHS